MWKSQEKGRSAAYDCEQCVELELVEDGKRICFQVDLEDSVSLLFPIIAKGRVSGEGDFVEVRSQQEMLAVLGQLKDLLPAVSIFMLLTIYFKQVCPVGLIKQSVVGFLDMECRAKEFHKLPYSGEMGDQPNIVVEAFDAVGIARAEWERDRMEKIQREAKAKAGKDRVGR